MRTVVLGERPAEIEAFLARRRALGQDRLDEVWEGVYHVAPPGPHPSHAAVGSELAAVLRPFAKRRGLVGCTAFNIGTPDDFRVPDHGFLTQLGGGAYEPTAVVVIEILSPDDETYDKFGFYAAHGVQEMLVAHPQQRWVRCYDLQQTPAAELSRSRCLDVAMAEIEAAIDWPGG
ncbi:MAG: Uma2 family endonuclease [Mycobacteriales bacterium]